MRTAGIILLAGLFWIVPAGATDFYFHMSWERDAEVTHATAEPGDLLRVFIRMDTSAYWLGLTLESVSFPISSDYPLTHLSTTSLNDNIAVAWHQQEGCGEVSWTSIGCGVRVIETIEYVSEHVFRVEACPGHGEGSCVMTWSPGFVEPLLYIWENDDCS
ncbi:hypothetical protein KKG45_04005, partial [bacterium]|nr:hypothetical protein [bacterium]